MPKTAITYQRVSTQRQATEGESLESQADAVAAYCKHRGYRLAGQYEDKGRSGRTTQKRPGLRKAINAACETEGVLVVYSLSRLARSLIDASHILGELNEAGAGLAIVDMAIDTAGPHGKLVFNIMSAMAEFESDLISQRIKASNAHSIKKRGYRVQGMQPLGFTIDDNKKRIKVPEEQAVLRQVKAAKKGKTYRAAAAILNDTGVPTTAELRGNKGKRIWTAGNVYAVLSR